MLKTASNPGGLPIEVFDQFHAGGGGDRSQFYQDLSRPFFGANRPGANVSQSVLDMFWLWSMQVGLKAAYDCIKAFSETEQTEDLRRFDVPTLIIHGDDEQIVPITAEDGYQAERSPSSASTPEEAPHVTLTVERLDDGKVSPSLTEELRAGQVLPLPNSSTWHLLQR
jgi:pimeloyl-ACP methyl ester carboxylesterase